MSLARLQDSANNAVVLVVPGDRIVGRRSIGDGVMRNMPLAASAMADEDFSRQSRFECSDSCLDRSTSQDRISQKLGSTIGR
jgi:hypothetical protein